MGGVHEWEFMHRGGARALRTHLACLRVRATVERCAARAAIL
jgi:hypothetical protein